MFILRHTDDEICELDHGKDRGGGISSVQDGHCALELTKLTHEHINKVTSFSMWMYSIVSSKETDTYCIHRPTDEGVSDKCLLA